MRPKILVKQKEDKEVESGFRFRISAEVGRCVSGRSPGSEAANFAGRFPFPSKAEWNNEASILTYSGGTAPVSHRLPFFRPLQPPEIHFVISQARVGHGESPLYEVGGDAGIEEVDAMSISTKRGDTGQTGLAGGIRVSKAHVRVEAYGTVDELNASLGLARSICEDREIRENTLTIQRELFRVGSALATPPESKKGQVPITTEMVDALTEQVHKIEAIEGMLSDWSVSGEHAAAAAYDVARTVCRRAERNVVRLGESGEAVEPMVLAYLNRLSDLLWLFGRKLEFDAGVNASLRTANDKPGARWSRAW
jgi:cob(I)alamin adenosyltransferase